MAISIAAQTFGQTANKYGSTEAALVAAHECYGIRNALEIQANNVRAMLAAGMVEGPNGFKISANKEVAKALRSVLDGIQKHYANNEERLEDLLPWTI